MRPLNLLRRRAAPDRAADPGADAVRARDGSAPRSGAAAVRSDPAPSRWAYRWHRLWLTPLFRAVVRVGLPAFVLVFSVGGWLSDDARRAAISDRMAEIRDAFHQRPEFMVGLLSIEGASPVLAESLRAGIVLDPPVSSFALDLDALHEEVESFDAVARASLRILPGGILSVEVTERLPAVVWRSADGLWLLDANGHRVASITARVLRADLPVIAGEGADRDVPGALALIAATGPLRDRLRGLVRVGERRWDLVLDRDQRILLPAQAPVRALEAIIALDQADRLLAHDLNVIDLRNPARPTLRLSAQAAVELRGSARLATGEGGNL